MAVYITIFIFTLFSLISTKEEIIMFINGINFITIKIALRPSVFKYPLQYKYCVF